MSQQPRSFQAKIMGQLNTYITIQKPISVNENHYTIYTPQHATPISTCHDVNYNDAKLQSNHKLA